jgi:hypothetical protein
LVGVVAKSMADVANIDFNVSTTGNGLDLVNQRGMCCVLRVFLKGMVVVVANACI